MQISYEEYMVIARTYERRNGYYINTKIRKLKRDECFDNIILLLSNPPTLEQLENEWVWENTDD